MWAIDFESVLPQRAILARFVEAGGWCWSERDSDRLGPYLSSEHQGVLFKLYDEDGYTSDGPSYTLAVRPTDACRLERAGIDALVERLLAAIDARDVRAGVLGDWR